MRVIQSIVGGRALLTVLAAVSALVILPACDPGADTMAQSQPPAGSAHDASEFIPEATILEIMDSMLAPSAEVLWNSVAFIATQEETIDLKPETEEDWQKLRWSAVIMAEASNALLIPGRRVDQPGAVSDDPDEELGPDEIQVLIDDNRPAWVAFANAMHAAAMENVRAIDARDVDALSDAGGIIDAACESCHLQFWYPQ